MTPLTRSQIQNQRMIEKICTGGVWQAWHVLLDEWRRACGITRHHGVWRDPEGRFIVRRRAKGWFDESGQLLTCDFDAPWFLKSMIQTWLSTKVTGETRCGDDWRVVCLLHRQAATAVTSGVDFVIRSDIPNEDDVLIPVDCLLPRVTLGATARALFMLSPEQYPYRIEDNSKLPMADDEITRWLGARLVHGRALIVMHREKAHFQYTVAFTDERDAVFVGLQWGERPLFFP